MTSLFISYASPDSAFALRLAGHLTLLRYTVWMDQWEISVGDEILGKLVEGLAEAEYLIVIVSRHTMNSPWVEREVQLKVYEEITQRRTVVLPVLIEDCSIPPLLRPKRMADFRPGYEIGLAQLAITLYTRSRPGANAMEFIDAKAEYPAVLLWSRALEEGYTDVMHHRIPHLTEINVELGIPYIGKITGVWKPDPEEQAAAWELYVELVTRVAVVELPADAGLLRESLSSLYAIFTITRDILRKYGPSIARPRADHELSLGFVAVQILNYALRPILAYWHPLLQDYEHRRDPSVSALAHEKQWEHAGELRQALHESRLALSQYTQLLAEVAGVPQLDKC